MWCELTKVESGSTVTRFISECLSPNCIDPSALRNKLSKLRAEILKLDLTPPTRDWNAPDNTLISADRWRTMYQPYAPVLEDLEVNLRGSSL